MNIDRVVAEEVLAPEARWREEAACLAYPGVLFFGIDDAETPAERRGREDSAKGICLSCSVRQECLDFALATREPYGIWGGLTEIERRARLRGRN